MKETIEFFKKTSKSNKGKAAIFFGAFALLIVILMIVSRVSTHYPLEQQLEDLRNANNKDSGVNIADLLKLNFSYEYVINIDDNTYKINGKINESNEEFTCNYGNINNKFYRNKDGLYRYDNLKWIKSNECDSFYKFYNIRYVNNLLDDAYLDHRTTYNDGREEFFLLLSVNSINKIIDDKTTDISDNPSTINVLYGEGVIKSINFDLTNYCLSNKLCKKQLKINLNYNEIGEVAKIDNPL